LKRKASNPATKGQKSMTTENLQAVIKRLQRRVYNDRELAKFNEDWEWLERLNEELYVIRLAVRALDHRTLKRLSMGMEL
jgi:hypothetical protein